MAMVFSAERPRKWPSGQNEKIEAPNRGQNPKEYPRNLGNPPHPRARVIPFTRAVAKPSQCLGRSATLALNTSSSGNPDRTLTLLPAWMTEPGQAAGHASSAIDREIGGIAFAGRCAHGVLHGGLALLSGSQRWGAHDANKGICSKRDGPQNFGPICGAG